MPRTANHHYLLAEQQLIAEPWRRLEIESRVGDLLRHAERSLRLTLRPIQIRYDLRGTAAGRANAREIRLNALLMLENYPHFLGHTVPHEVAHSVVCQRWPTAQPHGRKWRSIMDLFGCTPNRCHAYDVSHARVRTVRRYMYECACGPSQLSSTRHRRVQSGARYTCRRCRQVLAAATTIAEAAA